VTGGDLLELVERDAAITVGVGLGEEARSQGVDVGRGERQIVLGEAQRDHAPQLVLVDAAVAVLVVQPERERELVARRAGDQPPHRRHELVAADRAVAVLVEDGEHPPGERRAAEPERRPKFGLVDAPVGASVRAERRFEGGQQSFVDGAFRGRAHGGRVHRFSRRPPHNRRKRPRLPT
jgi:hypothetical protein